MRTRNKKILLTILTACLILFFFSIAANTAFAADYEEYEGGFKVLPDCYKDGICDLDDFVQLFVNLSHVGLKVLPYVAMIFMIWAGFNLIMAGGNPEKIQEGKKMLTSIIIGILIVTILAWSWSLFIVVVLTGSLEGKIFPGTPFEREWWGGGTVGDLPPEAGCCVVNGYGCIEVTREECDDYPAQWQTAGLTPPETNFMGEQQYCSDYVAQCSKWNYGCCVPTDARDGVCYKPAIDGCLQKPATTHSPNDCTNIEQCEQIHLAGEQPDQGESGCCVGTNNCSDTTYSDCQSVFGSFHANQTCSSLDVCTGGCCVGTWGCSSGKFDCIGTWNEEACDEGNNDPNGGGAQNCLVGCCKAPTNLPGITCYSNYSRNACIELTGGNNYSFDSADPSCSSDSECTNGCCSATCVEGNIGGACPNPLDNYYKTIHCNNLVKCDVGCCLQNGANGCVGHIYHKDCLAPGDQFFDTGGACPTGTGESCEEGCCSDPTQEYRCIDGYSEERCNSNGGTHFGGASCTPAPDQICDSGGSCDTTSGCVELTSSQTRLYCTNILNGTYSNWPGCP